MKKVLITLAIVLFAVGSANAMPMMLDPGVMGIGVTGRTGVFNQLGILVETTSTDYVNGDVKDIGDVAITSLIAKDPVITRGLNDPGAATPWYFTGVWTDLTGTQPVPGSFVYTSGTLDLYVNSAAYSWGPSTAAGDGSNFDTGFHVATLSLQYGTSQLVPDSSPDGFGGSVDLTWAFTAINQDGNFWLDENGNPIDLSKLSAGEKLFAIADANTDLVQFAPGNGQDISRYVYSDHNGSVQIGVVPEPASMALFGTGLFGLAGAGLRKKILG